MYFKSIKNTSIWRLYPKISVSIKHNDYDPTINKFSNNIASHIGKDNIHEYKNKILEPYSFIVTSKNKLIFFKCSS